MTTPARTVCTQTTTKPLLQIAALALLSCTAQAQNVGTVNRDVPFVPTPMPVVERMLEMANVQPEDYVVDLGSGDGRIVIAAARDYKVRRALGIDIDPQRVSEARAAAEAKGVTDRVTFEEGDLFQKDYSDADVLTMYLLPNINLRLRPVILNQLAPGTRVVSHDFHMEDWTPDQQEVVGGSNIYLWIVPAKVEGSWQINGAQGNNFVLDLQQTFQNIEGSVRIEGSQIPLTEATLKGDEIRFVVDADSYIGKVDGDRMRPLALDGAVENWSGTRF